MKTLAPHQQRVVDEKAELDGRLSKLIQFMGGDIFKGLDAAERNRMTAQAAAMSMYSFALGERIAAF